MEGFYWYKHIVCIYLHNKTFVKDLWLLYTYMNAKKDDNKKETRLLLLKMKVLLCRGGIFSVQRKMTFWKMQAGRANKVEQKHSGI